MTDELCSSADLPPAAAATLEAMNEPGGYYWDDMTQDDIDALVGKSIAYVELDPPSAVFIFSDGSAVKAYGQSAQSEGWLSLTRWAPPEPAEFF